jgi:hypothetical protein
LLIFVTLFNAGCINKIPTPTKCQRTETMKYILNVDGVPTGIFSDYIVHNREVILKNGVVPPGGYNHKQMWNQSVTLNHPLMSGKHDFILFAINSSNGKIENAVVEFSDVQIRNIDGAPSIDNNDCLIVDRLYLNVENIIHKPGGVWTNVY